MLEIRRYQSSDYDDVWDLHVLGLQTVGAYLGNGPWYNDLHHIEHIYLHNRGDFLVGIYKGRFVAMCAFRKTSAELAEIKRMRVHPDFQGRGFGQIMLDELEIRALALGYAKLHLDTSVKQVVAQKLYMKNGFREKGRVVHQGLECILFEKSLG